jgi:hypothetical protein
MVIAMISQTAIKSLVYQPVADGQERLATQFERDDVKRMIDAGASLKHAGLLGSQIINTLDTRREGDQINRFLLCALVNESSRQIKRSAQKAGATLPMTMIVRGVLRSYRLAATDEYGPLAGPGFDISGLRRLNDGILRCEIARHTRDSVKNSEARLAQAQRHGDGERIKVERDGLEHAIELRDRLAEKLR